MLSETADYTKKNPHSRLEETREALTLGYSVIPLRHGEKVPAIGWKEYLTRRTTDAELQTWFGVEGYSNYGIVLGGTSRLMVLDFDSLRRFEDFKYAFWRLERTLCVKTRRGYHLYFKIPENTTIDVQTHKHLNGVDLLYHGSYVVGKNSRVDGIPYIQVFRKPPIELDDTTLTQIFAFLGLPLSGGRVAPKNTNAFTPDTAQIHTEIDLHSPFDDRMAEALYRNLAKKNGRNNALFQVGCIARDEGWWEDKAVALLASVHAKMPAPPNHREETHAQRLREAQITLRSVFSHPRRRPNWRKQFLKHTDEEPTSWLPNPLREALLARKLTPLLRVLEGLNIAGVRGGAALSYTDMRELLLPLGVTDDAIRKAKATLLPSGEAVFVVTTPPQMESYNIGDVPQSEYSPKMGCTADLSGDNSTITALLLGSQNQRKLRGRKRTYYRVPTIEELCTGFGVKMGGGDVIQAAALRKVSTYRATLHAALIKRRPGQYTRKWQSRRLSVSKQTILRYDRLADVQVLPIFTDMAVYYHNIDGLIPREDDGEPIYGHFLECEGRRYPIKYGIAMRLLGQGLAVKLRSQLPNYYTMEPQYPKILPNTAFGKKKDTLPLAVMRDEPPQSPLYASAWIDYGQPVTRARAGQLIGVRTIRVQDPQFLKARREALEEALQSCMIQPYTAEARDLLINEIHTWFKAHVQEQHRISKTTLYELAKVCSLTTLERAFNIVKTKTWQMTNPGGFVVRYVQKDVRDRKRLRTKCELQLKKLGR